MKRAIITVLVVAAVLAGIIYILNKNKAQNQAVTEAAAVTNETVAVRIDTARTQSVDLSYIANGTLMPKQEVTVSAEASGRVVKVLVDEGSRVSAGQVLAVVEGDKLNVSVANAQAVYDDAVANVQRFESAYATGGVTKQQLDQVKLQFETAKNNLRSANLTAGDVTIKTSVSGIVNARMIEPGTYVSPGTAAFEIVNVSSLKLRVNVDEKHVATLKVGQTVDVTLSVYPDKDIKGRITFIAPKSDGSLNFPVEIEVANPSNQLRAGMYGTASFGSQTAANVLVIPRMAFVGSVSDNKVFIAKDGKAIAADVVGGRNFGDYVEILSGLEAGDQVIISGQINVFDQTPITIIK